MPEFDPNQPFDLVSASSQKTQAVEFDPSQPFQFIPASSSQAPATIGEMRRREEQPKDPLNRTPTAVYVSGWITTLLATFAVSWILARRRYNQKSGVNKTTVQEAEANPASFRRASLGVRRLASTLFWLFTIGCILTGIVSGGTDFRFLASAGLIMGLFSWVLIRGVDWIIRGFKFGG